jgi:hypothetical protein
VITQFMLGTIKRVSRMLAVGAGAASRKVQGV